MPCGQKTKTLYNKKKKKSNTVTNSRKTKNGPHQKIFKKNINMNSLHISVIEAHKSEKTCPK